MQPDIVAVEPTASNLAWFSSLVEAVAQYGFWVPAGAVLLLGLVVAIYRGTFMKLVKQVIEAAEAGLELPKEDKNGSD